MAKGRKGFSSLKRWEIAMVKAMLVRKAYSNQDILAHFTRPTRSVNHHIISEIRDETKHKAIRPASHEDLDEFLATWPNVDPQTGLSIRGDELLIKAREAMIAAVHTFNGAGLTFRAELFIVTAVIAWTYLLHAFYKQQRVDYRYKDEFGVVGVTKQKADRFWELGRCLKAKECPVSKGTADNLEFLLNLRHEIERRSTSRIDDAVSAKLQACCINFNDTLKCLFGQQYGLERRLPIALQFVTFGADQRALLKRARELPRNVEAMMDVFHKGMSVEEQSDPAFAYRVVFIPKVGARASSSDEAIEFVKAGSEEGKEITRILLKDVDRKRFSPKQIVDQMQLEEFPSFTQHHHTALWKQLEARDPKKGFGKEGLYKGSWEWFEPWLVRVRDHCQENRERYTMVKAHRPALGP